MKTKNSRLGLSILAGGLSFVGAANAMDLIRDGSFENPPPSQWKYFNTYNYSQAYYTGPAVPAEENPGTIWSWQHASAYGAWDNFVTPTNLTDHLQYNLQFADSQTVYLTNALTTAAVDAGLGRYTFSCWLASYGQPSSNPDQPFVVLRFFDYGTTQISTNVIFDRTTNTFAITYADTKHGKGTKVPADLTLDHDWIKYGITNNVPAGARKAVVYITRSPKTALDGTPDTYVDLLKLNVVDTSQNTLFDSSYPANGQTGVTPATAVTVGLRDNVKQVNTSSILFWFDASLVTPSISKSGDLTTVLYDPPGLMASLSAHACKVAWSDNGTPVQWKTNQFGFTVAPYINVNLGTPIVRETFDGLAPGTLPAGWTVANHTDYDTVFGEDLNNFHSDTFLNWTVIGYTNLTNWFTVSPGSNWYTGVLNVQPGQFINGVEVTNLVSTNFIIACSARAPNTKQIDYVYTGDYNLSGRNNVYLSFHNMYVQYANDIAAVEYSIDGGGTWLPALYMLEPFRIFRDSAGNIDAYTTFNWRYWWDVPNVDTGATSYGWFGQYIGVDSSLWSTLGPFISPRVQNDQYASKRVEVIRLAQADNQPTVRFRMAFAGVYDWYFAIDDFGLYSISSVSPPLLAGGPTPAPQTLTAGNTAYLTLAEPTSVFPFSYQWRHNGTVVPGMTGQTLRLLTASTSDTGSYDVVVTNSGGSTTSSVAVLTVLDQRPMKVTGQWDFLFGDLTASYGTDLQYNGTVADTTFGTTTSFGIADVGYPPTPTTVMHFTPSTTTGPWGGYKMYHGAAPNGGGTYVNQYTLIYDVYYPSAADGKWRSFWQTDTSNSNDGDLFVSNWNGLGISSLYDGWVGPNAWHRIAFAFDLSGPGEAPVLTKFLDGVKQPHNVDGTTMINQVLEQGTDGRWSLDPYALVFADESGDVAEAYVSSIQFSDGRRPDAYIQALGGPNALKIPGVIRAEVVSGQVVIRWSGGVALESADSLGGTWTTVEGTAGQYTYTPTAPLGQVKFYRPKIP